MQPGYLRVFDGLRVSTEHIEHFQDSLHSALGDLRRIAGVGRAHRGFTVTAGTGSAEVVVQPGLAFDYDGRRLVSDETITLAVPALAGSSRAFVCASYLPVEEGLVDGRATLGFDSARVELRTSSPGLGENTVVLATLAAPPIGTDAPFIIEAPSGGPVNGLPQPTAPANGNGAEPDATDISGNGAPAEAATTGIVPANGTGQARLPIEVRQGVLRLRGDESSRETLSVLARAMKRSAADSEAPSPVVTLASAALAPGLLGSSWTCHAVWSATLSGDSRARIRGVSQGEATADSGGALAQSCIYSSELRLSAGEKAISRSGGGLSDSRIAGLPFGVAREESDVPGDVPDELLSGLVISATLGPLVAGERALRCDLAWDGPITPAMLEWLETNRLQLTWSVDIVWKALGTTTPVISIPE